MAKQRRFAVPAAVTHLAEPRWQAKLPAMRRAKTADSPSPRLRRASWRLPLLVLPAAEMQQGLLQVKSRALFPAKSPVKANLVVWTAGWRPPLLEAWD